MPKKKKPLPPSQGERIPVGTPVILRRPNLWDGLQGTIETSKDGLQIVRLSYPGKPETFLAAARIEEMEVLSESASQPTENSSSQRPA